MSCNVCVETFNRSTHACITCQFCDFQACKKCQETYLTSSSENAHCMNCKHEWNYKTLISLFTRKFVDSVYKKHSEKVLLERERALLPATQPIVEEQQRQETIKKDIFNLQKQIRDLQYQVSVSKRELCKTPENEKQTFIQKCHYENCRGFLNSEWKCGICEMMTCSNCHEVKGVKALHTCKPENVKTAKLLAKDTKPCPKCATPIFKIEGCDQIWCTQCQTPFSWKTGRVENGVIHNPHYFEWLRKNGNGERNLLEVRCGREIDNHFISRIVGVSSLRMSTICRNIVHIRRVELPRYVINVVNDNQDLRVNYLTQKITEEKFKSLLQKRNREKTKKRDIANILNMYIDSSTDILYRFLNQCKKDKVCGNTVHSIIFIEHKYISELKSLITYTNSCFTDVSDLYKSVHYQIDNSGKFTKKN